MQGRAIATWTVVAALCLAYYAAAISASADKSAAYDEGLHLVAGYSYWTHGDFRLQPENGNLPQRWAAILSSSVTRGFRASTSRTGLRRARPR